MKTRDFGSTWLPRWSRWVLAPGLVGMAVAVAVPACSSNDVESSDAPADVASVALDASPATLKLMRGLHERFQRKLVSGTDDEPVVDFEPVIAPGQAVSFSARPGGLVPEFPAKPPRDGERRLAISLPTTSAAAFRIEDAATSVALEVGVDGAEARDAEEVDGSIVYRGALRSVLGAGGDVVLRPTPQGVEDFITLDKQPPASRVRYRIVLGERVAGLRLVENVLEVLDADGDPRLRTANPELFDADGVVHPATLSVEGCDVDTNPAAPWGRTMVDPGARECQLTVAWSDSGVAYPALLDPAWTGTGSMVTARRNFTLTPYTVLSVTKWLAVAGMNTSGVALTTAEIFNGSSWAATGSMVGARYNHQAVAMTAPNAGKVLVAGGQSGSTPLDTTRIFDNGSWTSADDMVTARSEFTLVQMSDGRIMAAGGKTGTATSAVTNSIELYTSAVNLWVTNAKTLGTARYGQVGVPTVSTGNTVVIAGGKNTSGTALSTAEQITHAATGTTLTVANLASMNYARFQAGAAVAGSRVLVAGGHASSSDVAEWFNGTSWQTLPVVNQIVGFSPVVSVTANPNRFLVVSASSNHASLYDTSTTTILPAGKPIGSHSFGAGLLVYVSFLNKVLVAGGSGGSVAEFWYPLGNGTACVAQGECSSLFCADGVCCNAACGQTCQKCSSGGTCNAVQNDYDDTCTLASGNKCDAGGACKSDLGRACSNGSTCASGFCADGVCCNAACNLDCQQCSAAGACGQVTSQDDNDTCTGSETCDASGVCKDKNGQTCQVAGDCASNHCSPESPTNVCCNAACAGPCQTCSATSGTCTTVTNGPDATGCNNGMTCNAAGQCRAALGQQCNVAGDCASGFCADGVCCGEACNGTCKACSATPGTCTNVTSGTDPGTCDSGHSCTLSGSCKTDVGQACVQSSDCSSGFCVDNGKPNAGDPGVCCAEACTGTCVACKQTLHQNGEANGTCSASKKDAIDGCVDSPPCGYNGECSGTAGGCEYHAAGGSCQTDECLGGTLGQYTCNGGGGCTKSTTNSCGGGLYLCANATSCKTSCTVATQAQDCTAGAHCDGTGHCVADADIGTACGSAGQCTSGLCVDGVCCNAPCAGACEVCNAAGSMGYCTAVAGGTADSKCTTTQGSSCGTDGYCNAQGSCGYWGNSTSCGTQICDAQPGGTYAVTQYHCSGAGACNADAQRISCGHFTCNGAACRTSCTVDTNCITGYYCSGGSCVAKKSNGASCSGSGSECLNGFCVDGVCCNAACDGNCQKCSASGSCGSVTNGYDDTCKQADGNKCSNGGQCLSDLGQGCGSNSDCTSGNCADGVCCSSSCTDPCRSCANAAGTCTTVITNQSDDRCNGTNTCDATGKCAAQRGQPCSGTSDCASGYCADHVCCDSACSGECQTCGGATPGTCRTVSDATDPDTCNTPKQCNSSGACELQNGQTCSDPGQCASNFCSPDGVCCDTACSGQCRTCTGATLGKCATVTNAMDPGTCDTDNICDAAGNCKEQAGQTCGQAADCATGYCVDGVCCENACAVADSCAGTTLTQYICDGTGKCQISPTSCSPYACTSGACVTTNCTADGDCATGFYCDSTSGSCAIQKDLSFSCQTSNECKSDSCADGVCCNETCDGADTCTGSTLVQRRCDSGGSSGACANVQADCGGYMCAGDGVTCGVTCAGDTECTQNYFCAANGTCAPRLDPAATCARDRECATGTYCVDGVCCTSQCSGGCQACTAVLKTAGIDGECGNAKAGTDPHGNCAPDTAASCGQDGMCDGIGGCREYPKGAACGATHCASNAVVGKVCDGAGTCGDSSGTDCTPYYCQASGCATSCQSDAQCTPTADYYCSSAGLCESKLLPATACSRAGECLSGYCVDGVCCDSGCTGQCEACDVSGSEGLCMAVSDAPHGTRNACVSSEAACAGACDGSNRQTCTYPGNQTLCGDSRCDGAVLRAYRCDSQGACIADQAHDCGAYACDITAVDCKSNCLTNADCSSGAECDSSTGQCAQVATACKDAFTVRQTDGTEISCAPYKCVAGACQEQCTSNSDCSDGYDCQGGECVDTSGGGGSGGGVNDGGAGTSGAAAAADDGGCGCRAVGNAAAGKSETSGVWLLSLLGFVALGRRRRQRLCA